MTTRQCSGEVPEHELVSSAWAEQGAGRTIPPRLTRFMLNLSCICVVVTRVIARVTGLQDSDKPLQVMDWNSLTLAGAPNLMAWGVTLTVLERSVESIRLVLRALVI
jgi:hypothetical protein